MELVPVGGRETSVNVRKIRCRNSASTRAVRYVYNYSTVIGRRIERECAVIGECLQQWFLWVWDNGAAPRAVVVIVPGKTGPELCCA